MDIIRLTGGQLKTVENLSTEKVIRFDADPAVIAMDINAQRAQKKNKKFWRPRCIGTPLLLSITINYGSVSNLMIFFSVVNFFCSKLTPKKILGRIHQFANLRLSAPKSLKKYMLRSRFDDVFHHHLVFENGTISYEV